MSKKVLTNLDLSLNEIQNAKLHLLAAQPSTGAQGQYFFNTTDHKIYYHDGTQWVAIGAGAVVSVNAKTGETIVAVNNDDPTQPKIYFNISGTQGDGVTVSEQADGLKVDVQDGDTTKKGIVQLTSTPSATDETYAATPKGANVTLEELSTATEGYLKTYEIKQGGVSVGKVDIPKDFLVKAVSVETCVEDDKPIAGLKVGDKYIDFTINVKSGTATDEHIYIACKDLGQFISTDQGVINVGSTSTSVTLPAGSEYVSSECFADDEKVLVDTKVEAATSSSAGSVTFTIASAYTNAITCNVAFLK